MIDEKYIQEIRELKEQLAESNLCKREMLTLDMAAKYLGISKSTLYKINLSNGIPFSKPAQKLIYYKRADLDAWMQRNYSNSILNDAHVKPRERRG